MDEHYGYDKLSRAHTEAAFICKVSQFPSLSSARLNAVRFANYYLPQTLTHTYTKAIFTGRIMAAFLFYLIKSNIFAIPP